ncbi:N-acetyltransferase [Caldibacillus lycopersici]|uniref:N-acetyltransferase n=1 Tax=Perspicuibacillus lycopersici TaxID=1325689 RepID=A0AAE3IV68_9BACI|nr:GNAT family N-acetyltransferase [Perspicuibacillus lycopersici]MCU9614807.1 N-acetyltransferase [Perspicuibacillus lycopersici]
MTEIKSGTNEFYVEDAGEVIARIEYSLGSNDTIVIKHTRVSEDHSGKGLGSQLVNKVAEYAKAQNKLIVPECSYAKKVLESKSEYQDVLAK